MKTIKLKKINLKKRDGNKHPDISEYKTYLVIYCHQKILGNFEKQWYGWNFTWFGSTYAGLQLDSFKEVYEVIN